MSVCTRQGVALWRNTALCDSDQLALRLHPGTSEGSPRLQCGVPCLAMPPLKSSVRLLGCSKRPRRRGVRGENHPNPISNTRFLGLIFLFFLPEPTQKKKVSGLTMVNAALPCTWCCLRKEGARSCTQDSFYPGSTLLPLSQISVFNTLARGNSGRSGDGGLRAGCPDLPVWLT